MWVTLWWTKGSPPGGQARPKGATDLTLYKRRGVPRPSHGSKKTKAWDDNLAQQCSVLWWNALSRNGGTFDWVSGRRLEPSEQKGWAFLKRVKCNQDSLKSYLLYATLEFFFGLIYTLGHSLSFCGSPCFIQTMWCVLWGPVYSWQPHVLCAHHWGAEQHSHKGWQRFRGSVASV